LRQKLLNREFSALPSANEFREVCGGTFDRTPEANAFRLSRRDARKLSALDTIALGVSAEREDLQHEVAYEAFPEYAQ
jgi:hypothetical protein